MLVPGDASIRVSWQHDRSCFEDHEFKFIVTWQEVDPGNTSGNMTMNEKTFNIEGLEPCANYKICVSAVSNSDDQVKSGETCRHACKKYAYIITQFLYVI